MTTLRILHLQMPMAILPISILVLMKLLVCLALYRKVNFIVNEGRMSSGWN